MTRCVDARAYIIVTFRFHLDFCYTVYFPFSQEQNPTISHCLSNGFRWWCQTSDSRASQHLQVSRRRWSCRWSVSSFHSALFLFFWCLSRATLLYYTVVALLARVLLYFVFFSFFLRFLPFVFLCFSLEIDVFIILHARGHDIYIFLWRLLNFWISRSIGIGW